MTDKACVSRTRGAPRNTGWPRQEEASGSAVDEDDADEVIRVAVILCSRSSAAVIAAVATIAAATAAVDDTCVLGVGIVARPAATTDETEIVSRLQHELISSATALLNFEQRS